MGSTSPVGGMPRFFLLSFFLLLVIFFCRFCGRCA